MAERALEKIEITEGLRTEVFDLQINFRRGLRRLTLSVKNPKTLQISAPFRASLADCRSFAKSHGAWIFERIKDLKPSLSAYEYLQKNPEIHTQGETLQVHFFKSKSGSFFVEDLAKKEIVFAFENEEDFGGLLLNYARDSIEKTVAKIADEYGFARRNISVRNQRSRWASRSSSDTLSFNWRIVLLNPKFQKYIVLHEYAHEKFMDHSVSFWIYLNRLLEGAKKIDKELSQYGLEIFLVER